MEEIVKILPKVLQPQLSRLEPPVVEVLAPLWTRVAGKALAKECHPVAFSAGTLTLATQDADWAEPLQQMAEEIRSHVNHFLGKPVVRHLRIVSVHKLDHVRRSPRQPEDLPGSQPARRGWPGPGPGRASAVTEAIGRSHAKEGVKKSRFGGGRRGHPLAGPSVDGLPKGGHPSADGAAPTT
jgi:hypothetical protein